MNNVSLKEAAAEARRAYQREYRAKNKQKLDEYAKQWRKDHPDKLKEYEAKHWMKKAMEMLASSEADQQRVDV